MLLHCASIYIASREAGVPRTLAEIASLSNISHKELSRVYRLIVLNLDLKVPMVDPVKCVAKIANKMEVSEKTKRHAMSYMHNVITSGIAAGKDPMGLAGAVLYLSCKQGEEHRTQLDFAAASGVTEVTLRNRCKELNTKLLNLTRTNKARICVLCCNEQYNLITVQVLPLIFIETGS